MMFPTQRERELSATTGRGHDGRWYLMVMDHSVHRDDWPRRYWDEPAEAPCARIRRDALQDLGYEVVSDWFYHEYEDVRCPDVANWGLVVRVRAVAPVPLFPADVGDLVDAAELTAEPIPEGAAA